MEDGWWMGELDGLTGLFPSIVVEECQANGDDWSPDVSLASPTSVGPPCFTPPGLDGPPPSLPPLPPAPGLDGPPPSLPPLPPAPGLDGPPPSLPPLPPAPGLDGPPTSLPSLPPAPTQLPPANVPAPAPTGLMAPETSIIITNPTPVVEDAEDVRSPPPTSYHVENAKFSMDMSSEKKEKYKAGEPASQAAAPDAVPDIAVICAEDDAPEIAVICAKVAAPEIAVSCEEGAEHIDAVPGNDCIMFTEIMVTAPTPRTQSPVDEEVNFAEAVSSVEKEGVSDTKEVCSVESKQEEAKTVEKEEASNSGGWANFQVIILVLKCTYFSADKHIHTYMTDHAILRIVISKVLPCY